MKRFLSKASKLFFMTLIVTFGAQLYAAAPVDWNKFSVFDSESVDEVQYGPYAAILRTLAEKSKGDIRMKYSLLSSDKALKYVETYLGYLQGIPVSKLNRDEQFAYWINLHNLGVLHLFITNDKSARKVKKARGIPGRPGTQWSEKRFLIEDQNLSLEDVEQNVLVRQWQDPNVLYGLYYGVMGSPPIALNAFTGKNVHEQLAALGKKFVNSKKNVKMLKKGLQVSSLYLWNKQGLFQNDDKLILDHIHSLAARSLAQKISVRQKIVKDQFNWRTVALSPQAARASQSVGIRSGGGS